eukprot:TRINITY_DN50465_c0_g1_i1.p1 TRINITY_DN50465_c0_g1~~TRINITY_DN50465_c0_g1_i1.p1  ORF type:complete len:463 (+),score=62.15 TRINITY_DN50465_c0_g1_i1:104-1390(+)
MLAYFQPNLQWHSTHSACLSVVCLVALFDHGKYVRVGGSTVGHGESRGGRSLYGNHSDIIVGVLPTGAVQTRKRSRAEEHHHSLPASESKEIIVSKRPASLLELDFGGPGGEDVDTEELHGVEDVEGSLEVEKKKDSKVESGDCMWVSWAVWSSCSVTCGTGVAARSRAKRGPFGRGMECMGAKEEVVNCNTKPCPVNCGLSQWSSWGTCSVSCGGPKQAGRHTRTRDIVKAAAYGGVGCLSGLKEVAVCNHRYFDVCPRDCELGPWTAWSKCSLTCGTLGGLVTRTRQVKHQSLRGGKRCNTLLSQTMVCNVDICPRDCSWFEWQTWTGCSKRCGNGQKIRVRDTKNKKNEKGSCLGSGIEMVDCFSKHCPIDCAAGDWGDWGDCSVLCGGGERSKTRPKYEAKYEGRPCREVDLVWTETCNMKKCT